VIFLFRHGAVHGALYGGVEGGPMQDVLFAIRSQGGDYISVRQAFPFSGIRYREDGFQPLVTILSMDTFARIKPPLPP
jgi:hypothetical protein